MMKIVVKNEMMLSKVKVTECNSFLFGLQRISENFTAIEAEFCADCT